MTRHPHVPLSHSWSFSKLLLAATVVIALKSSWKRTAQEIKRHAVESLQSDMKEEAVVCAWYARGKDDHKTKQKNRSSFNIHFDLLNSVNTGFHVHLSVD